MLGESVESHTEKDQMLETVGIIPRFCRELFTTAKFLQEENGAMDVDEVAKVVINRFFLKKQSS